MIFKKKLLATGEDALHWCKGSLPYFDSLWLFLFWTTHSSAHFTTLASKGGGEGGPCQKFLPPFHKYIFGQQKESISSKMPIIWTLNCSLDCIFIVCPKENICFLQEMFPYSLNLSSFTCLLWSYQIQIMNTNMYKYKCRLSSFEIIFKWFYLVYLFLVRLSSCLVHLS